MTDTPKPLMTGTRAAALLEDVLKWKLQLVTPEPGVRSVPTDTDGIRAQNRDALPFGLDHVIDTSWADGPAGTTTPEGVDKWLRFWTPWFSYWIGEPAKFRMQPGPWMLKHLTENPVFNQPNTWDDDDQDAWDEYTNELQTMHHRLATLTGQAPLVRSLCPKCKTGRLRSYYRRWRSDGSGGLEDLAVCSECRTIIDYTHDEHLASARAALRTPDIPPDRYLTLEEVQAVWGPMVKASTLRSWVKRGQVHKDHGKYRLADINRLKDLTHLIGCNADGRPVRPETLPQ